MPVTDLSPTEFAEHTSLRTGGSVARWIRTDDADAAIEVITECADLDIPCLVVGGGTNLVCGDAPYEGAVVQLDSRGIAIERDDAIAYVTVAAGESWDDLVAITIDAGLAALAPMSGIPGLVGATPVQNVGAYGSDIAQLVHSVEAWDRARRELVTMTASACDFAYRTSIFKREQDRFLITSVTYAIPDEATDPVRYDQLANSLGLQVGEPAGGDVIREHVLALRRSKAMVLDDRDHDTWSAGSFFLNPVIDQARALALPVDCPRYPSGEQVKVSAAWLIEASGVARGWRVRPDAGARVSSRHVLAIANAGSATTAEIVELAHAMRDRVLESFGIALVPEPRFVNCSW